MSELRLVVCMVVLFVGALIVRSCVPSLVRAPDAGRLVAD